MNFQEDANEQETPIRRKGRGRPSHASGSGEVRRCAYCDIHTPLEVLSPQTRNSICGTGIEYEEAIKKAQRMRMKKARKILAERRNAPPVVCMPVIPKERIQQIIDKVEFENKQNFFDKLVGYWLMKRHLRNGVPLLRRLQHSAGIRKNLELKSSNNNEGSEEDTVKVASKSINLKPEHFREQLGYWKKLRQDLEKARLLMELIRKRERIKRDLIRISHLSTIYEINPLNGVFLQKILDSLKEIDKNKIFHEPVDAIEVAGYYETIKNPMDYSKMQVKLNRVEYSSFAQFESDFNLIISNCLLFNKKNSYYYRAACKIRDQVSLYV